MIFLGVDDDLRFGPVTCAKLHPMNRFCCLIVVILTGCTSPKLAGYSFVQQDQAANTAMGSCSTKGITVATGDFLIVTVLGNQVVPVVKDGSIGNTYNLLGSVATKPGIYLYAFYAANAHAGRTALTVSENCAAIYDAEYSGIATSSPLVGSLATNYQNGPGIGANAISSGNVNLTTQPSMLWAFSANVSFLSRGAPTAGTLPHVLTGRTAVWNGVQGSTTVVALPEDYRVTSAGDIEATFGPGAGNSAQYDQILTVAAVFAEQNGR
jgi:hypothetical protein